MDRKKENYQVLKEDGVIQEGNYELLKFYTSHRSLYRSDLCVCILPGFTLLVRSRETVLMLRVRSRYTHIESGLMVL